MAEFTQTMSGDSRYSIKLTVTEVIPSDYITTNKTNVNYTLTATKSGGSGYWNNNANNPVKVTINGTDVVNTNVAYDFRNATPKTITLASGTVTGIEHSADGSKTIAVSGYFKDNGNSLGQATASGNLILTTIPRASIPTVDEAPYDYLGNTLTIRTNRASNSFTHTLKFKVGSTQIGSAVTGVGATYSWTPALSTYAPYTTNGLYATVTIECTTYNGSTQIGTPQTTSILMYVPANSTTAPDCSISIQEDNATMKTLNWGVYVKNKSQLKVSLTGTPKYNGYITDYSINANGNTKSGSNSSTGTFTTTYTTNILTSSGSVTASVKDNRGSTTNATAQSYTLQDYSNPQITTSQVYRCDSNGNQDDSGTYIKYIFGGTISSVSNKNSKTFTLRYRPKNGSWTTVGTWTDSYTCSKNGILSGFSTSTEYEFEFSATDSFTTTTIPKEIGTEPDMMNFNSSGKSMAIGGVSQRGSSESVLDVYTDLVTRETYVGSIASKNMFDKNNVEIGKYYSTSSISTSTNWCISQIPIKPNTNYYLSGNNYNNQTTHIVLLDSNKNIIQDLGGYKNVHSITTTSSSAYIGLSIANYSGDSDLDSIMVEKGTIKSSYTPYQELNPDNFKNKEIVVGSIRSKNMFDGVLELGGYTNQGVKDTYTTPYRNANMVPVKPNTTYTTSINGVAQQYVMFYYDNNRSFISSADNRTGTFTTPYSCYYVNFRCYAADFTPDFKNLKVQLETGSTATAYFSYQNLDGMENYSTNEQVIGTWINGKPLYRKVTVLSSGVSLTSNAWYTMFTDATIEATIKCVISDSNSFKNGLSYPIICRKRSDDTIQIFSTIGTTLRTYILEYTKTTD